MKKENLTEKELTHISISKLIEKINENKLTEEESKILRALTAQIIGEISKISREFIESIDRIKSDNQSGPVSLEQAIAGLVLSDSEEEKVTALERLKEHFSRKINIYRKSVDLINKGSLYAAVMDEPLKDGTKIEDLSIHELHKIPDLKKQVKSNYVKAKQGSYEDIKWHRVKRQNRIRQPKTDSPTVQEDPEVSEMLKVAIKEYSKTLKEAERLEIIRKTPIDEITSKSDKLSPYTERGDISLGVEWDPQSNNFPNKKNPTEADILFGYDVMHNLRRQLKNDGLTAGETEAAIKRLIDHKIPRSDAEKQALKRARKKLSKYL
jgi:hypothetical protein